MPLQQVDACRTEGSSPTAVPYIDLSTSADEETVRFPQTATPSQVSAESSAAAFHARAYCSDGALALFAFAALRGGALGLNRSGALL
jgi:hypothetical protein